MSKHLDHPELERPVEPPAFVPVQEPEADLMESTPATALAEPFFGDGNEEFGPPVTGGDDRS